MSVSTARVVLFVLVLLLTIVALAGSSIVIGGSLEVTADDAYSAILHKFFPDHYEPNLITDAELVIWNLRMPRIVMGILAGISLGAAGAVMQWALKNLFASPYTLGISSVAACGTLVAILFGGASIGRGAFVILGAAGISALVATAIILYITSRRWATPERVVLIGIVLVILSSPAIMILTYFGAAMPVNETLLWTAGNLNRASWDVLAYMAGTIVLCAILLLLPIVLPPLFGADERRTRTYAMVVASLLTASTVCFTGAIGFIGLLAPHICRRVIGDYNRFVILVSGLVGAVLLLGSDLVARTVISPIVLPVCVCLQH